MRCPSFFYTIGKSFGIPYGIKSPPGGIALRRSGRWQPGQPCRRRRILRAGFFFISQVNLKFSYDACTDDIRLSGLTQGYTRCQGDNIPVIYKLLPLCGFDGVQEEDLRAVLLLIRMGAIPQDIFNWRQVCGVVVQPTIWHPGRYLEIILAVAPDLLTVMMALAPRSMAVIQAAWEIAVVISGWSVRLLVRKIWL